MFYFTFGFICGILFTCILLCVVKDKISTVN